MLHVSVKLLKNYSARHSFNAAESFLSISFLVASHSFGYSLAALKINRSTNFSPTGNAIRSMDSGNTKWVPCSYTSGTYSQVWGRSFNRWSMRRIYFPASQNESSSAPIKNSFPLQRRPLWERIRWYGSTPQWELWWRQMEPLESFQEKNFWRQRKSLFRSCRGSESLSWYWSIRRDLTPMRQRRQSHILRTLMELPVWQ